LKAKIGYPTLEEEAAVLSRFQMVNPLDRLQSVMGTAEILELQALCRRIFIEDSVREYIVTVNSSTRDHKDIKLGTSTRCALALQSASQAMAGIQGRSYVLPDDVKALAVPVLSHRIIMKTEARLRGRTEEEVIEEILSSVPVPTE
jgi:MoxR-like ATPase